MPQTMPDSGPTNEAVPSRELIERVYGYIKTQQPCRIRDLIDAMQQFLPGNLKRSEIKVLVVKAMSILANKEGRIDVGLIVPSDTELSYVYSIL